MEEHTLISHKANAHKRTLYLNIESDLVSAVKTCLNDYSAYFPKTEIVITSDEEDINKCIGNPNLLYLNISKNQSSTSAFEFFEKKESPFQTLKCTSTISDEAIESNILQFKHLIHYQILGLQLHLLSPKTESFLNTNQIAFERIGNMKARMSIVEPYLRDTHLCLFDLNVIKKSEFPEKIDHNPSGFLGEEAIQFLKYAGLSPKLNYLELYNFKLPLEKASIEFIAQCIWYICHGLDSRVVDDPYLIENTQEFVIDSPAYTQPLHFLRSRKTGRWWLKFDIDDYMLPFVCVSCEKEDYDAAKKQEFSTRLIQAFEKYLDA